MRRWSSFIFILSAVFFGAPFFTYAGTIDSTNKYARFLDSNLGLINFGTTQGNVTVTDSAVTGYAWGEYVGWINLNPTNGGVSNNGYGVLTGYAWGEQTGWVNFNPTNGGVTIDASGNFNGYAWSETKGWIVFNCVTDSTCGTLSHKVQTDWIPISARAACNNTLDDDGDGKTDYPADPGCTSISDTSEADTTGGGIIVSPPPSSPPPQPPPSPPQNPRSPLPPPPSESVPPGETATPSPSTNTGGTSEPQPGNSGTDISNPSQPGGADSNQTSSGGSGGDSGINNSEIPSLGQSFVRILDVVGQVFSPQVIIDKTKQSITKTSEAIQESRRQVKEALETPEGAATSKTITTTGVVTGGVMSLFTAAFSPFSFSELFFLPLRLWALLLSALGIKRRHRPWGAVYDSVTKQPLDPAYVVLKTLDGKEIATAITDLDGRYGFFVPPGKYRITVNKSNYAFPSVRLAGKQGDEFYRNLYFGEEITVDQGGIIVARDIPMDPEGFDWNQYAKRAQHLTKFYSRHTIAIEHISRILFRVGFFATFIVSITIPTTYNIATFVLYILVWALHMVGPQERPHGVVLQKESGDPLAFAFLTASHPETGIEVKRSVTDVLGRYYCLVPKGTYRVEVTAKNNDGTYIPTSFSSSIPAPRGIIRKKIEV